MTELLEGAADVRAEGDRPLAVRTAAGWREVEEVVTAWRVEAGWWRDPVCRDYFRCLLRGGDCVELYLDRLMGGWHWSRRYD